MKLKMRLKKWQMILDPCLVDQIISSSCKICDITHSWVEGGWGHSLCWFYQWFCYCCCLKFSFQNLHFLDTAAAAVVYRFQVISYSYQKYAFEMY